MKKYFVGLRYHDAVAWHMLKDAVGTRSAILITVLACAAGTDPQAASIYASSAWYVHKAQYLGRNYCSTGTAQGTAVATPSGACAPYKGEKATCLGNAGSSIFYEWGCETKSGQCHDCRFNATMSAGGQCHSDNRGTPYTWSCIPETDIHHNVRCEAFPNDNCSGTPTSVTYDFGNENSGFCVSCNRSGSEKLVLNQCSKLVCLNCRPRDPASTYDLLTCEKIGGTGSQYCTCGPSLPTLPQPQRFSPRHVSGIGDEHGGNYVVGNAH